MTNLTALPIGTELVDDYRIDSVLGAGGFGITYLATEIALERKVTIKEYFPTEYAARKGPIEASPRSQDSSSDYKWGLERFLEEGQTLGKFNHPNIVRVYRYFRANNTGYMVLHFEEGQSFKSWLKNLGRAPRQNELDDILAPLLSALELIHGEDFLHRDIAPDNIIIRKDGTPVLIDFGSARREIASQSKTVSALVKPGYSPYEQYAETSRRQGPWTDIYALGATLYHAITGKRAPDAPSRMVSDEIRPSREAALSSYRQLFLNAIDAALALDIKSRPQSIAAWRSELLAPAPKNQSWLSKKRRKKQKAAKNKGATADSARENETESRPLAASDAKTVPLLQPDSWAQSKPSNGFFARFAGRKPQRQLENAKPPVSPAHTSTRDEHEPSGDVLDRTRDPSMQDRTPAPSGFLGPADRIVPPFMRRKKNGKKSAAAQSTKPRVEPKQKTKTEPPPEPRLEDEPVPPPPAFLVPSKRDRRWRGRPRPMRSVNGSLGTLLLNMLIGASIAGVAIIYKDEIKSFVVANLWQKHPEAEVKTTKVKTTKIETAKVSKPTQKPNRTVTGALQKNVAPNPLLNQISTHQGAIVATAFTKDGRWLVTLGTDNSLKIWNARSNSLHSTINLGEGTPTALSIQDSRAAVGHDNGAIGIWNLATSALERQFQRNEASIWSLAYTGTSGRLAAASHDWKVALWDTNSPSKPVHVFEKHNNAVQSIAFSPQLDYLATGGADRHVNVYNLRTLDFIRTYRRHNDFVTSLAFSPDGKQLATGTLKGEIRIWSSKSRRLLRKLRGHKGEVTDLAFSENGSRLASAGADGTVRIWAPHRGRTLRTYASHQGKVTDVAFDPNGTRLASVGDDGNIRMWQLSSFR